MAHLLRPSTLSKEAFGTSDLIRASQRVDDVFVNEFAGFCSNYVYCTHTVLRNTP
jgi:hypothetical protein